MQIDNLSAFEIHKLLEDKKISPDEVYKFFLSEIRKKNKDINAFIYIEEKYADNSDKKDWFIPIAIKDNIAVKDMPLSCASFILKDFKSPYDATVIERLRDKGIPVIGKTNLDEFAMGSSTEYTIWGPVRNPHLAGYSAGGSSGGSAAAVASGMVPWALGSDTGGSVRLPAAFCNIVGFKPTYGRFSRYGLVAFASSLDQIGTLTKTVYDSALLFTFMAGWDKKDSTSLKAEVPNIEEIFPKDWQKQRFKIGIPLNYQKFIKEDKIGEVFEESIKKLEKEGFEIKKLDFSHLEYVVAIYQVIACAEASSNLARYDGVRYGLRFDKEDLEDFYFENRTRGFGEEVKRRIFLGAFVLSAGYYEAYFEKAAKARRWIKNKYEEFFKEVDVIILPTTGIFPFKLGKKDPIELYLADRFTIDANLCGLPAISIPAKKKLDKGEFPIGIQFISKQLKEDILFQISRFFEEYLT